MRVFVSILADICLRFSAKCTLPLTSRVTKCAVCLLCHNNLIHVCVLGSPHIFSVKWCLITSRFFLAMSSSCLQPSEQSSHLHLVMIIKIPSVFVPLFSLLNESKHRNSPRLGYVLVSLVGCYMLQCSVLLILFLYYYSIY